MDSTVTNTSETEYPVLTVTIDNKTTTILIGDSTVTNIDLYSSIPPHDIPQKLCIEDLTVPCLTECLTQQTPHPNVKQATFHVGVHDCCAASTTAQTGLSKQQWVLLLKECRRVFPRARIQASSILPARGRKPLNDVIRPSNDNLREACNDLGVNYIHHHATFTAQSGAPKMALYASAIHPSRKGTAYMANNIYPPKRPPLLTTPPPSHSPNSHHPPGKKTLLQTPSKLPQPYPAQAPVKSWSTGKSTNAPSPPPLSHSEFPTLPSRQQKSPVPRQLQHFTPSLPPSHPPSCGKPLTSSSPPSGPTRHNPLPGHPKGFSVTTATGTQRRNFTPRARTVQFHPLSFAHSEREEHRQSGPSGAENRPVLPPPPHVYLPHFPNNRPLPMMYMPHFPTFSPLSMSQYPQPPFPSSRPPPMWNDWLYFGPPPH